MVEDHDGCCIVGPDGKPIQGPHAPPSPSIWYNANGREWGYLNLDGTPGTDQTKRKAAPKERPNPMYDHYNKPYQPAKLPLRPATPPEAPPPPGGSRIVTYQLPRRYDRAVKRTLMTGLALLAWLADAYLIAYALDLINHQAGTR